MQCENYLAELSLTNGIFVSHDAMKYTARARLAPTETANSREYREQSKLILRSRRGCSEDAVLAEVFSIGELSAFGLSSAKASCVRRPTLLSSEAELARLQLRLALCTRNCGGSANSFAPAADSDTNPEVWLDALDRL